MSWLIGYTMASVVGAFLAVRLFEYIAAGITGSLSAAAKFCIFLVVWTAITTTSGMRGFAKGVRQLRQRTGPKDKTEQD